MIFNLELYKSKIDSQGLNEAILNIVNVLEKYNKSYIDDFPINIDPFNFKIEGESLAKWKKSNNLNENITAEQAFYTFKEKYKIQNEDIGETRKIIAIRYAITQERL